MNLEDGHTSSNLSFLSRLHIEFSSMRRFLKSIDMLDFVLRLLGACDLMCEESPVCFPVDHVSKSFWSTKREMQN